MVDLCVKIYEGAFAQKFAAHSKKVKNSQIRGPSLRFMGICFQNQIIAKNRFL
jgi:hypothetical protein